MKPRGHPRASAAWWFNATLNVPKKRAQAIEIQVVPSQFVKRNKAGDFAWEIKTDTEPRTLYIFNDNAHDHNTPTPGGGNAQIRPYNRYSTTDPPRSAGISTGERSVGYTELNDAAKFQIAADVKEIEKLLKTGPLRRVPERLHAQEVREAVRSRVVLSFEF